MNINKFKTHLGEAKEIKIGEDKFLFKPLTIQYLPDIFSVISKFSQTTDSESPFSNLDKESINTMTNLIRIMIKKSYPDLDKEFIEDIKKDMPEDQKMNEEDIKEEANERIEDFIYNNYFALLTALFEINNLGSPKIEEDEEKRKGLLKRMNQLKDFKQTQNAKK